MESKRFNLKSTLLIFLLCILEIVFLLLIFNFKSNYKETQNLYLIKVRGYDLNNEFKLDLYEYELIVNDNIIEISCESDSEIEGCNVSLDLTDKESYEHKIKVYDGTKFATYTINIKKETKMEQETTVLNIDEIKGNTFEWTNKDINLEVVLLTQGNYLYSFDGGKNWQESNKLLVKQNGKFQVQVKDSNNVFSEIRNVEVDKIDKVAPNLTINKLNASSSNITYEVIANDELSGVGSISFNGGDFTANTKYNITKSGKYYFLVKDKAGNISEKKYIEVKDSDFKKEEKETKTYTITLNSNGVSTDKKMVSCTTLEDTCEVILPKIITNNIIIGWDTNKNSTTAKYTQGQTIKTNQNMTLYAITKRTYSATFNKNGATTIGSTKLTCTAYNTEKCEITTPTITRDGGVVIGWGTSSNSTISKYNQNKKIELTSNISLYAITKRIYSATFNKTGLDYLEANSRSCTVYNSQNSCNIILPRFNKKGYFNSFWSLNNKVSSNLLNVTWTWDNFNQVGRTYKLTSNVTLYPNFNHFHYDLNENWYRYRALSTVFTKTIGKTTFEFEKGIPTAKIDSFLASMNQAYKIIPWLFTPGKVFILTESTYNNYSIAYGLTHQMYVSYGGDSYFTIDLKYDTSGVVVKNAVDINAALHELGHAWDSYYYFKTGTERISFLSDFNIFYNSISSKLYVEDNGKKISKVETFAGMVTNYYWHILQKDKTKPYYALKEGVTLNATEQQKLKTFMEKYINVSNKWN